MAPLLAHSRQNMTPSRVSSESVFLFPRFSGCIGVPLLAALWRLPTDAVSCSDGSPSSLALVLSLCVGKEIGLSIFFFPLLPSVLSCVSALHLLTPYCFAIPSCILKGCFLWPPELLRPPRSPRFRVPVNLIFSPAGSPAEWTSLDFLSGSYFRSTLPTHVFTWFFFSVIRNSVTRLCREP